ncbi:MaoC family dehydratase [Ralstonia wenshanensis]|uniref:MaoC family dehydratase n=1 Tax=Ralstonia wenshanensis TaxID=2842456 RepID=UPI003D9594E5
MEVKELASTRIYLDDLAVGDVFVSGTHQLNTQQIIQFASQFDPQPFHLDPEAAKDTLFRGLAASGWHTMAITMRLLVQSLPFAYGVIGAGGEVSWPQPTRPDDVLHVTSTIVSITPSRSKPGQAIVVVESVTSNQHDEVRQKFTAKLLGFKKEV